jgi:tRNA-specific 2-thiouridylase
MRSFDDYILRDGGDPGATKIMVAMSGGVDSSVAAALLVERGYRVIGATLKLWCLAGDDRGAESCCSAQSLDDARSVCRMLDVPHYVIDLSPEFERKVVEPFCRLYLEGMTPNPCVTCNTEIKFGDFLSRAMAVGADFISTGHHVRQRVDPCTGLFVLEKGLDATKDQSYALWGLTQPVLRRTVFPIGWLTKDDVREKARALSLPVANKEESQDICFITDGDVTALFERVAPRAKEVGCGEIRNSAGQTLGHHDGYYLYTLGQRRGLGVATGRPQYVIRVDPGENVVYLGEDEDLKAGTAYVRGFNFVSGQAPTAAKLNATAKIRYLHAPSPGALEIIGEDAVRFVFERPQRAITPGQSLVAYDGDILIGGGIIERAER